MEEIIASPVVEIESDNVLKRKSDDVGWQYGKLVDPSNKDKVRCNFCGHVNSGGIYRLKQHIAHNSSAVIKCKKCPKEAQEVCLKSFDATKKKRKEKAAHEQGLRDDVNVSSKNQEEDITCVGSSTPHNLGPIDKWTRAIDPKLSSTAALQQQKINKAVWDERTIQVQQYVARWVYTHAIPFNAIDNDEFKQMCEAIVQFGPGFSPPSQYDLREPLLKSEYSRTKSHLKERDDEKMKNGCSLMTDAWTDMKRRSIMNLVTHCAEGTSFIKSKDTSDVSHTSEVIFNLVDKTIEELGVEHVVQVVTDNASNNMGAKTLLLEKMPNIFWSSCATHTINLMLQGIGNLPKFKKTIDQAKSFTIFIYGHHRTLECMRFFTKKREIIRPGVTRFASQYLTLQSLMDKKDALKKMVVDRKWKILKDVHTKKGKDATSMVLNNIFWEGVNLCLKVFEPLVRVLRLVDGDVKPSMGFVYGEIVKAKREIKEAFGNVEIRYKEVMTIVDKKMKGRLNAPLHCTAYMLNPYYSYADDSIFDDGNITTAFIDCVETFYHGDDDKQDQVVNYEFQKFQIKEGAFGKKLARTCQNFDYNPVAWWRMYGTETPNLQKMAMRILSLTSSSSGCERNWSTFESIHTKRRNRLTTDRLNQLVYIQFNSRLMAKKRRIKEKKNIDILLSSDATEAQGFLFEGGDDHAMYVFRDEEDGGDDALSSVVTDGMGTSEQLELRRSARVRDLHDEEFLSEEEEEEEDGEEITFEDDEDEVVVGRTYLDDDE